MTYKNSALLFLALVITLAPANVNAATAKAAVKTTTKKVVASKLAPIEISGWIPYWRAATGTADVIPNLSKLSQVEPFGFTVKNDGSLYDTLKVASSTQWQSLIAAARAKKVKVIPTVMWSSGNAIDTVLRDKTLRTAHEKAIVAMVKDGGYDGADLDYEGKLAETRPYFSLFLKELYKAMGKKLLYCTIEARTPPADAYDKIPTNIEYANDYAAINKYCDRVNIMTYDQGTIDLRLNAGANESPYVPVADPKWVEKVINLASKTIAKKKIRIGVATYGYEYIVTPLSEQGFRYERQWTFNPRYATDIAQQFSLTPQRNAAGEMSVTFLPTSTAATIAAPTTTDQNLVPMNALTATTSFTDGTTTVRADVPPIHLLWWSDAQAIKDKIALARKLGINGIAIFKLDGGEDPNMWSVLK